MFDIDRGDYPLCWSSLHLNRALFEHQMTRSVRSEKFHSPSSRVWEGEWGSKEVGFQTLFPEALKPLVLSWRWSGSRPEPAKSGLLAQRAEALHFATNALAALSGVTVWECGEEEVIDLLQVNLFLSCHPGGVTEMSGGGLTSGL